MQWQAGEPTIRARGGHPYAPHQNPGWPLAVPLGGWCNGSTTAFGAVSRGSNPCPPARLAYDAARDRSDRRHPGRTMGTRMRSRVPKVLHDVCGRPMIAWPVAAAREIGAASIVVVDSPARPLEGHLPDDIEIAVQPEPNGTGGAVAAALDRARRGPVLVLSGDVPLVSADAIRELLGAHARPARRGDRRHDRARRPHRLRPRRPRRHGGLLERIVETKAGGRRRPPRSYAIREVNTGIYVFDGGGAREGASAGRADNAQGERYLPDVLALLREEGAPSPPSRRRPGDAARDQRSRGARRGARDGPPAVIATCAQASTSSTRVRRSSTAA